MSARRRISLPALAGAAALVVLAIGGRAEARDLTVTAWGGASQAAAQKAYFKPFTEKTGIPLQEDSWSGGIGVLRTKVQGGNAGWDVVQVEVDELILGCEEGLFEKIDWSRLGGKDKFIEPAVNDCGIGAIVWANALGYDGDRLKQGGPANWRDFWDVAKIPGKRGLRKTAKYTLEIALMADGVAPRDVYKTLATPPGVDRAFKKLDELRPHVVWWTNVSQVPDLLASGEVIMSVGTPARFFAANRNDKRNFKVVWDGNLYSLDYWVILKGSPNKENAVKFLAFATAPENQKVLPSLIPLGVTNKEAIAQADPAGLANTPTNPDNIRNALNVNAEFWVENADQLNQRFNAWAAK
jgi:putative spermidine/putrescine transport system substrate-binding protein